MSRMSAHPHTPVEVDDGARLAAVASLALAALAWLLNGISLDALRADGVWGDTAGFWWMGMTGVAGWSVFLLIVVAWSSWHKYRGGQRGSSRGPQLTAAIAALSSAALLALVLAGTFGGTVTVAG